MKSILQNLTGQNNFLKKYFYIADNEYRNKLFSFFQCFSFIPVLCISNSSYEVTEKEIRILFKYYLLSQVLEFKVQRQYIKQLKCFRREELLIV
jgi:hypothetical protein